MPNFKTPKSWDSGHVQKIPQVRRPRSLILERRKRYNHNMWSISEQFHFVLPPLVVTVVITTRVTMFNY